MHRKFNFEDIDIKRIMKSPDIFPEADSIIEEFKKKTYPKIEEINSLIATSRGSEGMIEQMSPLKVFIPAYFHKREAWNLGNKMAETISKDQDFENIFISYMNKYGLSSKNFVPYYAITKQQILNLEEDKFIRKWKKKALESAQSPLIIDILKPYPQEIESDIDFIISRGIDTGYWKRNDDGLLGLCKEVFVWTSEKIRTIFFQRILGLSKNEIRKANSSQAEELSKWFLWFVNREKIYFESPEEYSFLYKSPSPDFIIDTVICKYGGIPPHHDYFGTLELVDNTYFMLLNTYNHRLMELFKPERIEDCRTRFFTERQIKSYLSKERILQEFLGLFFNYALVRELDEIIHEFVERKLFSC